VSLGGKVRLHSGGQGLGFVKSTTDEGRRGDVKLTEVVQGVAVFRIELYTARSKVIRTLTASLTRSSGWHETP